MTAELVMDRIRWTAELQSAVTLTPAEVQSLADWIRRASQEINAPYQCYWRDRALAAEAKLNGSFKSND